MTRKLCQLILCSVVAVSQAANLRGLAATSSNQTDEREPRLVNAELINAFHDTYGWELVDYFKGVLARNYDPMYVGEETTVNTSGFDLPPVLPDCLKVAEITVSTGYVHGLSDVEINSFAMVPGTENIEFLGFMGSGGMVWNGTLAVNATFSSLTMDNRVSLVADGCNIEEEFDANPVISNATVVAEITIGGRTDKLQGAICTSKVNSAHVESLNLTFGSIDLGVTGASSLVSFALGFLGQQMDGLVDGMAPLLLPLLNEGLEAQMPYDEFCKQPDQPPRTPPPTNATAPPEPESEDEEIDVHQTEPATEVYTSAPSTTQPPAVESWRYPVIAVALGIVVAVLAGGLWWRFFRKSPSIKAQP